MGREILGELGDMGLTLGDVADIGRTGSCDKTVIRDDAQDGTILGASSRGELPSVQVKFFHCELLMNQNVPLIDFVFGWCSKVGLLCQFERFGAGSVILEGIE